MAATNVVMAGRFDDHTDRAVAQLRRIAKDMQAAIRGSGARQGRQLTLADVAVSPMPLRADDGDSRGLVGGESELACALELARARPRIDPAEHFGAALVARHPHLAWLSGAHHAPSSPAVQMPAAA